MPTPTLRDPFSFARHEQFLTLLERISSGGPDAEASSLFPTLRAAISFRANFHHWRKCILRTPGFSPLLAGEKGEVLRRMILRVSETPDGGGLLVINTGASLADQEVFAQLFQSLPEVRKDLDDIPPPPPPPSSGDFS